MDTTISANTAHNPFQLLVSYVEMYHQHQAQQQDTHLETNNYLAFSTGGINYLLSMKYVFEVLTEVDSITPLPFSPGWLLGLTSHRSEIYSVIDFKSFVDQKLSPAKKNENYILLRDAGQGYILKVEAVYGIRSCEVASLQSQYDWIDGNATMNDKNWLRINLENLVADVSFIKNM